MRGWIEKGFDNLEAVKFLDELSDDVRRAIADMGYEEATPIQAAAIPPILEGKDVIGQAQTGTGKTAAFGIPLVESLDPTIREVQALVLCPTRELALQTAGELKKLSRYRRGLSILPVYGGAPIERQMRALRDGVQVVVGTPGRVMDHMRRGTVDFSGIHVVVLDEADEMLDMGFRDDIQTILEGTPEDRQTVLFSATMPRPILNLAKRYQKNPMHIEIARKEMTVEKIDQSYISVRSFHKVELLSRLLVRDDIHLALVFCNTKKCVEEVVTQLQARGFTAAGLHGDMRQIERDAIMARYRQGSVAVLVATDVAARGLDIENIEAVFNYDVPQDVEYYVHRIGRTGRAGKAGKAYTFVVGREVARMWEYRKITGAKILCEQAPTGEALLSVQRERLMEKIRSSAGNERNEQTLEMARTLLDELEHPEQAVAAMMDMLLAAEGSRADASIDLRIVEPPRQPRPAAPQWQRRGPQPVKGAQGAARPAGRSWDERRDGWRDRGNRPYKPRAEYGGRRSK